MYILSLYINNIYLIKVYMFNIMDSIADSIAKVNILNKFLFTGLNVF